eukprot:2879786-Pyramimonas_sp.AAC.1
MSLSRAWGCYHRMRKIPMAQRRGHVGGFSRCNGLPMSYADDVRMSVTAGSLSPIVFAHPDHAR